VDADEHFEEDMFTSDTYRFDLPDGYSKNHVDIYVPSQVLKMSNGTSVQPRAFRIPVVSPPFVILGDFNLYKHPLSYDAPSTEAIGMGALKQGAPFFEDDEPFQFAFTVPTYLVPPEPHIWDEHFSSAGSPTKSDDGLLTTLTMAIDTSGYPSNAEHTFYIPPMKTGFGGAYPLMFHTVNSAV
jgi:hypothetical protein